MAEGQKCCFKICDLLQEVINCLSELSLKENEISWELNEISRPTTTKDEKSKISEPKLRMFLNNISSFQNELRTILNGLQEVQNVLTAKQIHWRQLLEESKIVKIKACLTIVKNSACYKFKSQNITILSSNLSSSKLSNVVYRQPLYHNPIANYSSLKEILSSLTTQEPNISSIVQVRSGGKVLADTKNDPMLSKVMKADKNLSNILKCALDLEEKLLSEKVLKTCQDDTPITDQENPLIEVEKEGIKLVRGTKEAKKNTTSGKETKNIQLEDICSILDNVDSGEEIADEEISEEEASSSISQNNSKLCQENVHESSDKEIHQSNFIDAKTNKILGETLENLNRIFKKLEEMEGSLSTNRESINNVAKNMEDYSLQDEQFVDTEEYSNNSDESIPKDTFFSAQEHLLINDTNGESLKDIQQ